MMPGTGRTKGASQSPQKRKKKKYESTLTSVKAQGAQFIGCFFPHLGQKLTSWETLSLLLTDPINSPFVSMVLLFAELLFNAFIIRLVPYTEIDWRTYMQQVEMVFQNGTVTDYALIRGDTGPLPYPAGHLWVFTFLYWLTNQGRNIRLAQYIFAAFYLYTLAVVFAIYSRSWKLPPFVLAFMSLTAHRVHSIYVLRLFNDPVAMMFLYTAILMFTLGRWRCGSVLYSISVSIKMNTLLFAPGLLAAYLILLGYRETVVQLSLCALTQILLAAPFLLTHPLSYLLTSFDLGRVFLFKWTVNWRFLPKEIFLSRAFHVSLLLLHGGLLLLFTAVIWRRQLTSLIPLMHSLPIQASALRGVPSQLLLLPLFTSNLLGILCSRSLHYQFYIWYYHTIPYLLWSTPLPTTWRLLLMGIIEFCWNTYPSTVASSAALFASHLLMVAAILWQHWPSKSRHEAQE